MHSVLTRIALVAFVVVAVATPVGQAVAQEEGEDEQVRPVQPTMPRTPTRPRIELMEEHFEYDEAHPAVGHWHGNMFSEFGVPVVSLDIDRSDDGGYQLAATVMPGNVPNRPVEQFEIDGRSLTFDFPIYIRPQTTENLHFEGEISEDGQRLRGDVVLPDQMIHDAIEAQDKLRQQQDQEPFTEEQRLALFEKMKHGTFELGRSPLPMDLSDPIAYGGDVEVVEDVSFRINLVFAETTGGNWVGHIDIPDQFVAGWALDKVERDGDEFIVQMGGAVPGVFKGTLSEDGGTYKGEFNQADTSVPFEFSRIENYTIPSPRDLERRRDEMLRQLRREAAGVPSNRPQYPVEPFPYETRDVTIEHPDGVTLAGTLTVPEGEGPFPAVILLSEKNAQTRDNTIYGHKTFLVLADALTREGIAVLRYDDRGTGESAGQFASSSAETFASDALAAYSFLRAIEDVDPAKIGFLGYGEGSIVATLAAQQAENPAFVVMLGPAGVPGWRHEVSRTEQILADLDIDEALKEKVAAKRLAMLKAIAEGEDEETVLELATTYVEAQVEVAEATDSKATSSPQMLARLRVRKYQRAPEKFLLTYDPAEAVAALDCPILALWGGKDTESTPELHRPPLESSFEAADLDATTRVYQGLNHMFQPAETGDVSEYSKSPITFSDQVMHDIADWILDQTD